MVVAVSHISIAISCCYYHHTCIQRAYNCPVTIAITAATNSASRRHGHLPARASKVSLSAHCHHIRYPISAGLPALRYDCGCNELYYLGEDGVCHIKPQIWSPARLAALVLSCVAVSLLLAFLVIQVVKRQRKLRHNLALHVGLLEDSQCVCMVVCTRASHTHACTPTKMHACK